MRSLSALAVVFAILSAAPVGAQVAVHSGYPNVNEALEIGQGEQVHLLNRVLVDRGPGVRTVRRMDFQYRTAIAAADAGARAAQAERAAQVLGPVAVDAGARVLSIAICDTEACGRRAEPPRVWYVFELRAGNVWKLVKN